MRRRIPFVSVFVLSAVLMTAPAAGGELCLSSEGNQTRLSFCERAPFHATTAQVTDARLVEVTGSSVSVVVWNETPAGDATVPYYAVSLDGQSVNAVAPTSYELRLRYARFDPAIETPAVDAALTSDPSERIYIVQFLTPPLSVFREQLRALGAAIHRPLHNHAYVVEMSATVKGLVEALPYVRAVVPYHPAYRLEDYLVENLHLAETLFPLQRYNIMVSSPGLPAKTSVGDRIAAMGGTVDRLPPGGFLLEATLTPEQLLGVIRFNEVLFVDRWGPPQFNMDVARQVSGANYVETTQVPPFLGQGVIGEVLDSTLLSNHQAFRSIPPLLHGPMVEDELHGTAVYGIVFGDGRGAPIDIEHPDLPPAKGMIPAAQGVFAAAHALTDRHCHTCELVSSGQPLPGAPNCEDVCGPGQVDPRAPYNAVFQTNSWGSDLLPDSKYTTVSSDMDDILFSYDILTCQAQGNDGNPDIGHGCWNSLTRGHCARPAPENRG